MLQQCRLAEASRSLGAARTTCCGKGKAVSWKLVSITTTPDKVTEKWRWSYLEPKKPAKPPTKSIGKGKDKSTGKDKDKSTGKGKGKRK